MTLNSRRLRSFALSAGSAIAILATMPASAETLTEAMAEAYNTNPSRSMAPPG